MYDNLLWKINPTFTHKNDIYQKFFKLFSERNISYYYHENWMSEAILIISHFCDPVDYSLLGASLHGILQARILEWVAISFPGGLLNPEIEPTSPTLAGGFFVCLFVCFLPLSHHGNRHGNTLNRT